MKALFAIPLLVAVLIQDTSALAKPSSASPLIGSWAVDVSRLPIPPEARPKSVTIRFGDAGNGKWATQVDIVDAGGARIHAEGIAALDGTAAPVEGSPEADVTAVKMPAPNVLVMQLGKGGMPASTRVYTVAADGNSMIEIAAYFGDGGVPVMRTDYFTRVR